MIPCLPPPPCNHERLGNTYLVRVCRWCRQAILVAIAVDIAVAINVGSHVVAWVLIALRGHVHAAVGVLRPLLSRSDEHHLALAELVETVATNVKGGARMKAG